MKKMKCMLCLLLALVMLLSCFGNAFAAEKTALSPKTAISLLEGEKKEELKGFQSKEFKELNVYAYGPEQLVRAIVLLEGQPEAAVGVRGSEKAAAQRVKLLNEQKTVRKAMSGISYELKNEFTALLNGFSCELAYKDLERLAAIPGVKAVHIANYFEAPTPEQPDTAVSGIWTGNARVRSIYGTAGQGMVIAVLDTGTRVSHEAFRVYDGDYMASVAALKQEDAALAQAPGVYVSPKIPFAYDYAEKDADVTDYSGHGTHVAGIALGYAVTEEGEITFSGAAPAAQLLAMKVFPDEGGGTYTDIYFDALEDAYRLGADVINLSLGSPGGFTYDSDLETEVFGNIYRRLSDAGIILCVAAGNEYSMAEYASKGYVGPEYQDYGTVASPSTYEGNLSVASAENAEYPDYVIRVGEQSLSYTDSSQDYLWRNRLGGRELPYVTGLGIGTEADYAGKDVAGKIAVVLRGETSFEEKVETAYKHGAAACIVVNNEPGLIYMQIESFEIPAICVGLEAMEIFETAEEKTVVIPAQREYVPNPQALEISDFSNWGSSPTLTIDPTFTSIGGHVYSCVSSGDSDYDVYSGTSMAAPNAAGTFANVLSALREKGYGKEERAELAKSLLESSAQILDDTAARFYYSVRRQGAGLANSFAALELYEKGAYIVNPLAELGHDPERRGKFTFELTLKNDTDRDVIYDTDGVMMNDVIDTAFHDQMTDEYVHANALYSDSTGGWVTVEEEETFPCYITSFTDCPSQWYHEYVDAVVRAGLMNGVDKDRFAPESTLTRAMAVTVLYRMAGAPAVSAPATFTDVPQGLWYSDAVAWAQAEGVVNGVTETKFAPEEKVTREQIAAILWRAEGKPVPNTDMMTPFDDMDQVSDYAKEAMTWAVCTMIYMGGGDRLIRPQDDATRAEFAAIITRFADKGYDCRDTCVVVPAGGEKTVKVNLELAPDAFYGKKHLDELFPYGTYLEGFVRFFNEETECHATFLAYYGDWTEAPVLESCDFMDAAEADNYLYTTVADELGNTLGNLGYSYFDLIPVVTDVNLAYSYSEIFGQALGYVGDNLMDYIRYDEKHIAISNPTSNGSFFYADTVAMLPAQLRNVSHLIMTVSNKQTGEVYLVDDTQYLPKAYYDTEYGMWSSYGVFMWDGTDAQGEYLPSGTVATIRYDAVLPYENARQENIWSFDVTVDSTAPVIEEILHDEETRSLTVSARDENYLAGISLMDEAGNTLDYAVFSGEEAGERYTATFDLSGEAYEDVVYLTVAAMDYASNEWEQELSLVQEGAPATVTYVMPEADPQFEEDVIHAVSLGDNYIIMDYAPSFAGYEFECWVTKEYAQTNGDDVETLYYPGDMITIGKDLVLYPLFAKGTWSALETPSYYFPLSYDADFSGDWAICGWDYDAAYNLKLTRPIALGKDGEEVDVVADLGAVHDTQYVEFTTDSNDIRFTAVRRPDGSYTLQNHANGKYLALADGQIAMVETVDAYACWNISDGHDNNALVYNAGDKDMILVYDDEAREFAIYDDTVVCHEGTISDYDYYPQEWFFTRLYVCQTEEFLVDYYTTQLS